MVYERARTDGLRQAEERLQGLVVDERYELLDYLSPGDVARVLVLHVFLIGRRSEDEAAVNARRAFDELFDVAAKRAAAAKAGGA